MLTAAQQLTLKTDILAKQAVGQPLAGVTDDLVIANYYNGVDASATKVWSPVVKVSDILDQINWARFTPNAPVDNASLTTQLAAAQVQAQLLVIQTKQMNLQNMLIGRDTIDATKGKARSGLMDAVTALPAGTAGALVDAGGAGGVNVLNALLRATNASVVEKLLSAGPQATGTVTADVLGFYGPISYTDISLARQS